VTWLGSLEGHVHHSVGSKGLEEIAAAFMAMVCPLVNGAGSDQDYIINVDQPLDRQRTLELVDTHTFPICKLTCDTKWATLARANCHEHNCSTSEHLHPNSEEFMAS